MRPLSDLLGAHGVPYAKHLAVEPARKPRCAQRTLRQKPATITEPFPC
jgi:hypothetical protein